MVLKIFLVASTFYTDDCLNTWKYWNMHTGSHVPQPQSGGDIRMHCEHSDDHGMLK